MLDVASAIAKLQERRKYCDHAYQMACANVMDLAFVSTEASPIRNVAAWRWRRDFADKAIVQLRGAYDKGASDVVKMVLAAEPTPGEIERMLEHLPRRFAEGCRVRAGRPCIGAYATKEDLDKYGALVGETRYPKINEEGPRHTATIGTGGRRHSQTIVGGRGKLPSFEVVRHWLRDGSYITTEQCLSFCAALDATDAVLDFDSSNGEVHINDHKVAQLAIPFWHIEAAAIALAAAYSRSVRGEVSNVTQTAILGTVC